MVGSFKYILATGVVLVSCAVRYEKLTYQRTPYSGKEIMTNGYFYCMDTSESRFQGKVERRPIARTLFFYKNGVMLSLNKSFQGFDRLEMSLTDSSFLSKLKNVPYWWGIFLVNDREIT